MTQERNYDGRRILGFDGDIKRRGLMKLGTLVTAVTGATALSGLGIGRAAAEAQPFSVRTPLVATSDPQPNVAGAVNVIDYGAKGDGKESASGGAIVSGTSLLTVSGAGFTPMDVGKAITVRGAAASGANLTTTIDECTGPTTVNIAAIAELTVSAAAVSWGTDDSSAIQEALNFAGPKGLQVSLPRPSSHYVLTSPLTLNAWCGLSVRGDGWETTELRQYSDNTPIFRWPLDNVHSQTFERMRLTYANAQNYTIGPRSVAFARDIMDGTSSLCGLYHHAFRDLKIIGATYGFKILRLNTDTTSTNAWWGCEWSRILFTNINRSCIALNLGIVGAPSNRFDQIKVFQNQTYKNDGQEACFQLRGEAVMTAIDVEQWHNRVIDMPSGNTLDISNIHVEHHYVDDASGGNRLFYVANLNVKISGLFVQYDSVDRVSKYVLFADTNTRVEILSAQLGGAPTGGVYLFSSVQPSARLICRNVNACGFTGNTTLWARGSSTIASMVEVEGMPPVLQPSDVLPAASARHRGRRYTLLGNGTTTADRTVQCIMSASGVYSWKTLISG